MCQTIGLLNANVLSCLPRGASLSNVARGSLLVESDLPELIDHGHICAATLDVTDQEPRRRRAAY
jgi:glyoxylate/hydroxypyruvate reductase A